MRPGLRRLFPGTWNSDCSTRCWAHRWSMPVNCVESLETNQQKTWCLQAQVPSRYPENPLYRSRHQRVSPAQKQCDSTPQHCCTSQDSPSQLRMHKSRMLRTAKAFQPRLFKGPRERPCNTWQRGFLHLEKAFLSSSNISLQEVEDWAQDRARLRSIVARYATQAWEDLSLNK